MLFGVTYGSKSLGDIICLHVPLWGKLIAVENISYFKYLFSRMSIL